MRNPVFFSKPAALRLLILFSIGWFSNLAGLAQTAPSALAQTAPPYKDPHRPIEERIKDLLSRMTKEEKFWQFFMIPGDLD